MNAPTRTRSTWWHFPTWLLCMTLFVAGGWWALAELRKEPGPDPEAQVNSATAFSLARDVDQAGSLAVRQELAKAIEDGKLTFAEHQRVSALAANAIAARNVAEAMAALDIAAKGYSE